MAENASRIAMRYQENYSLKYLNNLLLPFLELVNTVLHVYSSKTNE